MSARHICGLSRLGAVLVLVAGPALAQDMEAAPGGTLRLATVLPVRVNVSQRPLNLNEPNALGDVLNHEIVHPVRELDRWTGQ